MRRGIIDDSVTGQTLRFGDPDAVIDMVQKIAYREGFGNQLAEGSYRLAQHYEHPEVSVTTRKQEFPGYDPRGSQGMGLLYATSNKGASHMEGDVAYTEVFGVPLKSDGLSTDGKGELVARWQDAFALIDSGGLCVFFAVRYVFTKEFMIWPVRLAKLLNLTTGADYSEEEVMRLPSASTTLSACSFSRPVPPSTPCRRACSTSRCPMVLPRAAWPNSTRCCLSSTLIVVGMRRVGRPKRNWLSWD